MHYDVIIIGAGMSGLAAGIRAAYFGRSVCIVERHYAFGGLNSYYTIDGRPFDVGLHAVTNFARPGDRSAPLNKLLRQLRLTREDFDLRPQKFSEIRFPGRTLRFANEIEAFQDEVARVFPGQADLFARLCRVVEEYDDTRLDHPFQSTRSVLAEMGIDPVLQDMLLCPVLYYGSPREHDIDFTQFVILFKALYVEGFARPREGVRRIIKTLVRSYRANGGKILMRCGVEQLVSERGRVTEVVLEDGRRLSGEVVLSSAGRWETMRLCGAEAPRPAEGDVGRLSFIEGIAVLDCLPHELGAEAAVVFYCDSERFRYAVPDGAVDTSSGVICCPSNYADHEDMAEGYFRVTWLAHADAWMNCGESEYAARKAGVVAAFRGRAAGWLRDFERHLRYVDLFTPRTVHRYTGHLNGAVYGAPRKVGDGRTHLENLFLCGTDQGYLGIVGAMLSGITMANMHVLDGKQR